MIKAFKKTLASVLTLSFVLLGCVLPADADSGVLKTFGNDIEFTSKKEKSIADDSIIMRVGNRDYIVSNHRRALADGFEKLRPYVKNGASLIPVQSLLEGYGIDFEKGEDHITFKSADGREYTAKNGEKLLGGSKTECELFSKRIFADANDMAKLLNKKIYNDNDLIVFSDSEKKLVDSSVKNIKDALSWEWAQMFMGSEGFCCGIIENPKKPEERYVRTDVGGCYRWIPEANRWLQLFSDIPGEYQYVGVYGFAVDPNNDGVLYAACGMYTYSQYHRVLKSTDYGRTWKETSLNKVFIGNGGDSRYQGECLAVDPNNSNRILCGTPQDGLWISDDAGETWYLNDSIPNVCAQNSYGGPHTIVYDFDSPVVNGKTSVVYISNYSDALYKSTDGGDTFKRIDGSPERINRAKVIDGKLYAAASNLRVDSWMSGLYIYDGTNWEDITPPFGNSQRNVGAFLVDKNNKNLIIASGHPYANNERSVYRSWDGGKSWEYFSNGGNVTPCDFYQDAEHPEKVWYPHGRGVYVFKDIYADKAEVDYGDEGIEMLVTDKLLSLPAKNAPKLMLACWDRGYEYSDRVDTRAKGQADVGIKRHYGNFNDLDYCESDPNIAFGVTRESMYESVIMLTDYGRTLVPITSWDSEYMPHQVAVGAVKQENGWPIVMIEAYKRDKSEAFIFRSKDGGKTWEKLAGNGVKATLMTEDPSLKALISDRVNPNVFYWCSNGMYNNGDGFYVTKDGGETWSKVSNPNVTKYHAFYKSVPNREGMVWLRADGGLYTSSSYGSSFVRMDNVDYAALFGFGKGRDGSDMPAAYMYGRIKGDTRDSMYISDDLGATWRKIGHGFIQFSLNEDLTGDGNVYGRCYITTSGCGVCYVQAIDVDDHGPLITMENKSTSDIYGFDYAASNPNVVLRGSVDEPSEVRINNEPVSVSTDGRFEKAVTLCEGENTFRVEAVDVHKNKAKPVYINLRYIPGFFAIEYDTEREILTNSDTVTISGSTSSPAEVHIGDTVVNTDEKNKFSADIKVTGERSELKAYAVSKSGTVSPEEIFTVEYDSVKPEVEMIDIPESSDNRFCIIKGRVSENARVRVNDKDVVVKGDLTFNAFCSLENGRNLIKVQAKDTAGNVGKPMYYIICCNAASVDTSKLEASYKTDVVLDGNLDEWQLPHRLEKPAFGSPNNVCDFNVAWDDEYLYVAAKVIDDVIFTSNQTAHENDCVEIYYDGQNDKSTKYDANDKQLIFVAGTSGENYISKLTEDGYTLEVRIPFADMKATAKNNALIGFDIDVVDNDATKPDSSRNGAVVFNGSSNNWCDPSGFATIKLAGKEK